VFSDFNRIPMTNPTNNNQKKTKLQEYLDLKEGAKTEIRSEYDACVEALYADLRKAAAPHLAKIESLRITLADDFNAKVPKLKLDIPKEGGASKGRSRLTEEQKKAKKDEIRSKVLSLLSNGKKMTIGELQKAADITPVQYKEYIASDLTGFEIKQEGVTKYISKK